MKKPMGERIDNVRRGSPYIMSKKRFIVVTLIYCLVSGGLYSFLILLLNPGPFVGSALGILMLIGVIIGSVGNYRRWVRKK